MASTEEKIDPRDQGNPQVEPNSKQEAKDKKKSNKKDKHKSRAMDRMKSFGLALVKNPAFWGTIAKAGSKIVAAMNHKEWYGGETNKFTGPVGPYITNSDSIPTEVATIVQYAAGDFENVVDTSMAATNLVELITAFDKWLGFESGVTADNISDYIASALKYSAVYFYARKMYSSRNCEVTPEIKFSEFFDHMHGLQARRQTFTLSEGESLPRFCPNVELHYDNINNTTWLDTYASQLKMVMLTTDQAEWIKYLFEGFFSNGIGSGVNAIIDFMPINNEEYQEIDNKTGASTGTLVSVSLKDMLDSARAAFIKARNANKYLETLLKFLGFTKVFTDVTYLQRDPIGDAYQIKVDDDIIVALENLGAPEDMIYRHSADIDFTYDYVVQEVSIGEWGSAKKLRWLNAFPAFVTSLRDDGNYASMASIGLGLNVTLTDISVEGDLPSARVSDLISLDLPNKQWQAGGYLNVFQLLGLADTRTNPFCFRVNISADEITYTVDYASNFEGIGDRADVTGLDAVQIAQHDLADKIAKTNFTLGTNYYTTMETNLEAARQQLLVK